MRKILIVEDDHRLSESISGFLEKDNYKCDTAFDGQMALKFFSNDAYSVVILDLNLPKINGMDLCKRFRDVNPQVPILVITAFSDIDSKMEAFNLGADDYLVKPFHLKELSAKVKIFLKRAEQPLRAEPEYDFMGIKVDPNKKSVFRDGKEISLTPKEYSLLEYLLKNKNRIISKDELARNLWDENYGITHNTVEVYINFLRNKIDRDFSRKLILTKPGFGYYLSSEE
jgi:two-component system copper resistance phosphate regulon response regulator CusR